MMNFSANTVAGRGAQFLFIGLTGLTANYSAKAPAVADPPEDVDLTVTARVDVDGATIRPPHFVFAHIADGVRNAELVGFDRMPAIDRHRSRSSRQMRLPNVGQRFEVHAECIRGGEAWALRRLLVAVKKTGYGLGKGAQT